MNLGLKCNYYNTISENITYYNGEKIEFQYQPKRKSSNTVRNFRRFNKESLFEFYYAKNAYDTALFEVLNFIKTQHSQGITPDEILQKVVKQIRLSNEDYHNFSNEYSKYLSENV